MKILNTKQIKQVDQATIKSEPILSVDLMERAAYICFNWINIQDIDDKQIHVFCGLGNNGGDGLAIARFLYKERYKTGTYVVHFSDKMSNEFITNYQRAEEQGIHPENIHSLDDMPEILEGDIVIDALFGIGLNKPPRGIAKEVIDYINKAKATVYSVDVPSGLYIDKPVEPNQSIIKSVVTLTFQTPKLAFLLPDYGEFVKRFELLNIGLDLKFIETIPTNYHYITASDVKNIHKKRQRFSHKGSFGHALLIGGSFGKIGAAVLASKAALKIGSGLVTAYIPKCGYTIMQTSIPEVMVEVDAEDKLEFFNFKVKPTVIGVGVGMGTTDKTTKGFGAFLKKNKLPLVIDADALNIISKNKEYLGFLPEDTILTPHPKELQRLIGKWQNDYQKLEKVKAFSKKNKCILVLKGAHTVIVQYDQFYFNSSGTPALATAGTGDVLTGLITGLLAQKYSALEAAIMGVYLHGKTANIAEELGNIETFIASDIIKFLPIAMDDLINKFDQIEFDDIDEIEYFDIFNDKDIFDDDSLDDLLPDDDIEPPF